LIGKLFYHPDDPYLQEIMEDIQQACAKIWLPARMMAAAGFLGLGLFSSASITVKEVWIALAVIFLSLAWLSWKFAHARGLHWLEKLYSLPIIDAFALILAIFYPLIQEGNAASIALGLTLVAVTALSFCARRVAMATLVLAVAWMLGGAWAVWLGVPAWRLVGELIWLLAFGTLLTYTISFLQQAWGQKFLAERELHEWMLEERLLEQENRANTKIEYTDKLTGLGTRAAFDRDSALFTKVFAEGRIPDLTIAVISIENFQALFHNYGAPSYGKMIQHFAKLAKKRFRSSDMVYRLNNYQFALLAPGASRRNAERLEQLLHEIVRQVQSIGYAEVQATMGISTLDEAHR